MPNFKVGDRVIYARVGKIGVYVPIGSEGKIQMIKENGAEVKFKDCFQTVAFESLDLLSKFAVGQIYRSTCEDGEKGNIVKIVDASGKFIKYDTIRGIKRATSFLNDSTFANGLVLLTGKQIGEAIKQYDADHAEKKTQEDFSQYTEVDRTAKIGEKVKVVKAENCPTYRNGDVMVVTSLNQTGGVWAEPDSEGESAYLYRSEYVVLESKGGAREVKRAAKVGEVIKIVEPSSTLDGYKKGDTAKVTRSFKAGVFADFECGNYGVYHCEYVVLEGCSTVKEVKRRAKIGEYLKVVDASTDEGYNYSNGDILKCTFVGSCGIQARSGAKYGTLVDHEYVVLEGYNPGYLTGTIHIAGKHIWKPEEVEKAKALVLDTIREIYEESKGSVVFSRDVYSDKIFDAYLIEKGYSKLGYRPLDDAVIAHKARKGTAKCSPTDEPNVWIGKCVALCKALHKPIPSFIMGEKTLKFSLEKAKKLGHSKDSVRIHCKNHKECIALSEALDALGYVWCATRERLTERFYDDDMTYKVLATANDGVVNAEGGKRDGSIEFSDCLTGD